ncbi:hypothetical protein [Kutzneria sp. 744]|nr:hypothetical protein [Kutzneria sp. 744]
MAKGREQGARLVTGGGRPAGLDRGFYLEPTACAPTPRSPSAG